jgi:Spy/CpxP family protein refolding chaperone
MPVLKKSMTLLAAVVLVCAATAPVPAVTCEDVRSLSRAEQDYWSKRLNLTREQRHQIWQACYGGFRTGRAGLRISKSAE